MSHKGEASVALARFTVYVAPIAGRPGRPLRPDDDPARTPVGWRLLAANNRDVARSAHHYPDVATCLDAVCALRRDLGDGVIVATRADASGRAEWPGVTLPGRPHAIWAWLLRVGPVGGVGGADQTGTGAIAISSRGYQRRLQCEAAGALFVALVPDAAIDELSVVERHSFPGRSLNYRDGTPP
jgi:hypothetical protein